MSTINSMKAMTKLWFSIPLILLLFLPIRSNAQCYELVWSDEFDYTGFPDPALWTFEVGGGGWGNNELQYYKSNDPDNSWVEDGKLTITAINESYGGRNYTSARIITRDKYSVQYGKIEARMKLPYGQGIWPAFWAMGQNIGETGWPACGEIDIMEFVGGTTRDNQIHGTAHWDNNGSHAQYGNSYRLPAGIFADTFHTFSVVWTPQYIRWYVDDIQYLALDIRSAGLSEFHQNFFILLNLAVGGNWPGVPDATTVFPQTYVIDYVRVYKNTADIQQIAMQGDTLLPPKATAQKFSLPAASGWSYTWSVPEDAVIDSGQGTEEIYVTWGCQEGTVYCSVTGICETYEFSKNVSLQTKVHGPMFITEDEENVLFYTDSLAGTSFNWTVPEDAVIVSGQGSDSIRVNWGTSFQPVVLRTENFCGVTETALATVKAGQYPYPDISSPHSIPGVIEAVDFDYGGKGVSYHDSGAGNQGTGDRQDTDVDTQNSDNGAPNVGWITAGEWLEYTVKVETDSFYFIDIRVATANATGGPFSFIFNGEEVLNGITVANTGSWSSFITKRIGTVYLTAEDTLMRVFFNGGGLNIGKITFTPTSDPTDVSLNSIPPGFEIYPVPARESVTIYHERKISGITLLDMNGRVLKNQDGRQKHRVLMDVSEYPEGIYLLRVENG
ncbi:MAG: family 16 glycosylhydrolase, partial [Bacteroidales bacterium]|nr:family 16 glycosylhydrolase [Bacteroidales bacterium]